MEIFHAIITRFNLSLKFGTGNGNTNGIDICRDSDYLEERFNLFEKYTFPSVMKQTSKEFKWIVMFHSETPKEFKDRIAKLESWSQGIFIPIYMTEEECKNCNKILNTYLFEKAKQKNCMLIVTTRMDNDDAINEDYVKEIQKNVEKYKEEKNYCITYKRGLQYIEKTKNVCNFKCRTNHFLSLVVPINDIHNALEFHHGKMEELYSIYEENTEPMWLEIIHDLNYANTDRTDIFSLNFDTKIMQKFQIHMTEQKLYSKVLKYVGAVPVTITHCLKRAVGLVKRRVIGIE